MPRTRFASLLAAGIAAAVILPAPASVSAHDKHNNGRSRSFRATLRSIHEVPSISSPAEGSFQARLSPDGTSLAYKLSFSGLRAPITQSHIHFGQSRTNGGIMVFLCSGPTNIDPTGLAPTCPTEGEVEGTITAANIIQPGAAPPALGQGIAAGEFEAFVRALREGSAYANVHTTGFASGEIRGQIK